MQLVVAAAAAAGCLLGLRRLRRSGGSAFGGCSGCGPERSADRALRAGWNGRVGLMRSQFEQFQHRRLPGRLGLRVQYSPRHVGLKRKAELPQTVPVQRAFDPAGFHFGKANPAERLLWLECRDGRLGLAHDEPSGERHPVLINISPLADCHVVVPFFLEEHRPQVLSEDVLARAVALAGLSGASTRFKLMFNSLGGWASQNHLHWHGLLWPGRLPIETASRAECARAGGLVLSELVGYPLPGLVLEGEGLAGVAMGLVERMLELQIAHNLLIADGGRTVVLVPRQNQAAQAGGRIKMAVLEVCGQLLAQSEEQFASVTEQEAAQEMRERVGLPADTFSQLRREAIEYVQAQQT